MSRQDHLVHRDNPTHVRTVGLVRALRRHRLWTALSHFGVWAAVGVAALVHGDRTGDWLWTDWRGPWLVVFAVLLSLAAYIFGFPSPPGRRSAWIAASSGTLVLSALQALMGQPLLPRFVLIVASVTAACWLSVTAQAVRLTAGPTRVGVLSDDQTFERLTRDSQLSPVPLVLTQLTELPDPAAVDLIVVSPSHADRADGLGMLWREGVQVRSLHRFYLEVLRQVPVFDSSWVELFGDVAAVHTRAYAPLKRALDVLVGVAGTLVLVPVIPLVFLLNRFGNRGPLFFTQPRVGRDGAVFKIVKFRTMRPANGASVWSGPADDRITKVGRVLRVTHLDELPQVWNLLRGDMSVVGPRPEQPEYVEMLAQQVPHFGLRHIVRPGLTGHAQVQLGYVDSVEGSALKLQHDLYYLTHQSLLTDLRIMWRTVRSVFTGDGR